MQEAWVWFMVKELKSHRLQGQKKILNKTNKQNKSVQFEKFWTD